MSDGEKECQLGPWTRSAIEHGGCFRVSRGSREFRASMEWTGHPGGVTCQSFHGTGSTLHDALARLEDLLCEDAADEMRKAGAV